MDFLGLFDKFSALKEAFPKASEGLITDLVEVMYNDIQRSFGRWPTREFPYPIWIQPLAQSTQQDRREKGYTADRPLLRNGYLRDTIEKVVNTKAGWAVIGSPQKYALYQELGTVSGGPGNQRGSIAGRYYIPPRPIFGKAVLEAHKWLKQNGSATFGNYLQL